MNPKDREEVKIKSNVNNGLLATAVRGQIGRNPLRTNASRTVLELQRLSPGLPGVELQCLIVRVVTAD